MSRRITLLVLILALASTLAVAGDKPWYDMENCAMCASIYSNEGLVQNMTWEQLSLSDGVICITTVDEEYLPAYREAHANMVAIGARLQNGEQIDLCGSCTALGQCMAKGVDQEYVETSTGDVWIITSEDDEVVGELQDWAKRNTDEAAKMKAKQKS